MAFYPDEVENEDYKKDPKLYKEKFNNLPAVREANLVLVDSRSQTLMYFLCIFSVLILSLGGIYVYLVNDGKLTPVINNDISSPVDVQNNFTINPVFSVPVPVVNVYNYYSFNSTVFNQTEVNDTDDS